MPLDIELPVLPVLLVLPPEPVLVALEVGAPLPPVLEADAPAFGDDEQPAAAASTPEKIAITHACLFITTPP